MHRRATTSLAAVLLVLLTAACLGDDAAANDPPSDDPPVVEPASSDSATTEPAADPAGSDEPIPVEPDGGTGASAPTEDAADAGDPASADIVVSGVDYAFEGLPAEVAVGTTVAFTNASDVEAHELVLVRLPDDEDRPVEELLEDFEPTGEPALVSVAGPGEDGQVFVGDGTLTEPGRYIAVCFLPVGGDPEEILNGDGPPETDAPPHAVEGMIAEVVVS